MIRNSVSQQGHHLTELDNTTVFQLLGKPVIKLIHKANSSFTQRIHKLKEHLETHINWLNQAQKDSRSSRRLLRVHSWSHCLIVSDLSVTKPAFSLLFSRLVGQPITHLLRLTKYYHLPDLGLPITEAFRPLSVPHHLKVCQFRAQIHE